MVERRSQADSMTYYTRLIIEEQRNIQESVQKIAEYSRQLARVSEDVERKLLPRE